MASKNGNSRTINSINNLVSSTVYEFISYLLKFVMRTVFINTLGVSYLGISGLFSNILMLLSLAELGFGTAIMFRLYDPLKKKNEERITQIMNFFKVVYRIVAIAIFVIGLLLMPFLKFLIKDFSTFNELKLNAYIIFLLYLLQTVSSYLFSAYRQILIKADQKSYVINIINCVLSPITNVVLIIILVVTKNYMLYLITMSLMAIVENLIRAYIIGKQYPYIKNKTVSIDKAEKKAILKDCWAIFLRQTSSTVIKTSDTFVISAFLGLNAVGFYSNYYMIYTMLNNIPKKLIASIQASLGNKFIDMPLKEKEQYSGNVNFAVVVLYGVAACAVGAMINEVIGVWLGYQYVISEALAIAIAFELYITGLKQHISLIRNTWGLFSQFKYASVVSAVVNVVVSIALIRFGIVGVIIGTIVSDVLVTMTTFPLAIYKEGLQNAKGIIKYYLQNFIYLIEFICIAILCRFLCLNILVGYGWLSVIVHGLLTGVISLTIFLLVNCWTKEFKDVFTLFKDLMKKLFTKKSKNQGGV